MKLFLFSALSTGFATTVAAQEMKPDLKKLIEKSTLSSQLVDARTRLMQPGITINVTPGIYKLHQDNMPCIIPDTKAIAVIPNPLAGFKLPDVAAIPNPPLQNSMDKIKSLSTDGSK